VVKVDALKDELSSAFRNLEQSIKTVLGELVCAVDTVVERYNDLEAKHDRFAEPANPLARRVLALQDPKEKV
jgi:hypothetical protein